MIMGEFTDFYRPVTGKTYCEMLQSNNLHQWSTDGSNWETPRYWSEHGKVDHLGGSTKSYPKDGRFYLSFWGSGNEETGGCCVSKHGESDSWKQAFQLSYARSKIQISHINP